MVQAVVAGFGVLLFTLPCWGASLRVAAFDADASPRHGEPLIWTTPTSEIRDTLHAKGIILDDGSKRYVLCAIDWCGIGNRTHKAFRERIAKAAGTRPEFVSMHSIHQHTAPYIDGSAYDLMRSAGVPVFEFSDKSIDRVTGQVATAVRQAVEKLEVFDRIGTGMARIDKVASARRLIDSDGKVITRYSTGGKSPDLAAAPEGAIDADIRTVAFARGSRPIARLFYYATHPQTWCCDGVASADALGEARQQLEREQKSAQVYFTGCSGDVTVGKYNDGSPQARQGIKDRLLSGMKEAISNTEWDSATQIAWKTAEMRLPVQSDSAKVNLKALTDEQQRYRAALRTVFATREEPLLVSMLSVGKVRILQLPGEPMLEFQRYAQTAGRGLFVAVAGYSDTAPGYICTDVAYDQGGYEPSASNTTKGAEAVMKQTISKILQ